MNREMREFREALQDCVRAMDVARDTIQPITTAQIRLHNLNPQTDKLLDDAAAKAVALIARTEAGADGVSIWRYRFRNSETGGWHEWRYSEQEPVLNSFVADKTEIQGPFTHPQDASGDAEDARRYRWLKDRSTRKSVMDSAKQNGPFIAIGSPLSGFHVPLDIDSDVDAAMQAKEAK